MTTMIPLWYTQIFQEQGFQGEKNDAYEVASELASGLSLGDRGDAEIV